MKNQQNIIIGVVTAIIVVSLVGLVASNKKSNVKKSSVELPQTEAIPTLDSSVQVQLTGKNRGRAVELSIDNIPDQTTSIEYSMSYQTKQQGLQGIIGTIEVKSGEKKRSVSRELGTCSSGTCIYHEVDGKIKLELKFSGVYGERIYDKEFEM